MRSARRRSCRRTCSSLRRASAAATVGSVTHIGIATRLYVSERTVETHVASILAKLGVSDSGQDHRRVLAVVTYLRNVGYDSSDVTGIHNARP